MDNTKNFAKVTLDNTYDDVVTSVDVITSDGSRLPSVPFNAVWWNSTDFPDPSDDPDVEIVRVTARATDTLTIARGHEGTGIEGVSGSEHSLGGKTYKMLAGLTAKDANRLLLKDETTFDTGVDTHNAGFYASGNISSMGDVTGVSNSTTITVDDDNSQITMTGGFIPSLPSSDPAVTGQLYFDAGTGVVKRSAG